MYEINVSRNHHIFIAWKKLHYSASYYCLHTYVLLKFWYEFLLTNIRYWYCRIVALLYLCWFVWYYFSLGYGGTIWYRYQYCTLKNRKTECTKIDFRAKTVLPKWTDHPALKMIPDVICLDFSNTSFNSLPGFISSFIFSRASWTCSWEIMDFKQNDGRLELKLRLAAVKMPSESQVDDIFTTTTNDLGAITSLNLRIMQFY